MHFMLSYYYCAFINQCTKNQWITETTFWIDKATEKSKVNIKKNILERTDVAYSQVYCE